MSNVLSCLWLVSSYLTCLDHTRYRWIAVTPAKLQTNEREKRCNASETLCMCLLKESDRTCHPPRLISSHLLYVENKLPLLPPSLSSLLLSSLSFPHPHCFPSPSPNPTFLVPLPMCCSNTDEAAASFLYLLLY